MVLFGPCNLVSLLKEIDLIIDLYLRDHSELRLYFKLSKIKNNTIPSTFLSSKDAPQRKVSPRDERRQTPPAPECRDLGVLNISV